MLQFNVGTTHFIVLEDNRDILVSRIINYKTIKMLTSCDGSVGGLGKVTTAVSSLDDVIFCEFSRIQSEAS